MKNKKVPRSFWAIYIYIYTYNSVIHSGLEKTCIWYLQSKVGSHRKGWTRVLSQNMWLQHVIQYSNNTYIDNTFTLGLTATNSQLTWYFPVHVNTCSLFTHWLNIICCLFLFCFWFTHQKIIKSFHKGVHICR